MQDKFKRKWEITHGTHVAHYLWNSNWLLCKRKHKLSLESMEKTWALNLLQFFEDTLGLCRWGEATDKCAGFPHLNLYNDIQVHLLSFCHNLLQMPPKVMSFFYFINEKKVPLNTFAKRQRYPIKWAFLSDRKHIFHPEILGYIFFDIAPLFSRTGWKSRGTEHPIAVHFFKKKMYFFI